MLLSFWEQKGRMTFINQFLLTQELIMSLNFWVCYRMRRSERMPGLLALEKAPSFPEPWVLFGEFFKNCKIILDFWWPQSLRDNWNALIRMTSRPGSRLHQMRWGDSAGLPFVVFRISVPGSWAGVHGFWFKALGEIMAELVYNLWVAGVHPYL